MALDSRRPRVALATLVVCAAGAAVLAVRVETAAQSPAPTALAVRMAEAAGMTLVAVAREDGFEVFTHPHRIDGATAEAVSVAGARAP